MATEFKPLSHYMKPIQLEGLYTEMYCYDKGEYKIKVLSFTGNVSLDETKRVIVVNVEQLKSGKWEVVDKKVTSTKPERIRETVRYFLKKFKLGNTK